MGWSTAKWQALVEEAGVEHSNLAREISRIHKHPTHTLALDRNIDQQVKDLFDNQFAKKAPRTLMKRAGHVAMCIRWCKGKNVPPFELSEAKFVAHGDDRRLEKAPATQVENVRWALAFATSLMELDTPAGIFASHQVQGVCFRGCMKKRIAEQSRPL